MGEWTSFQRVPMGLVFHAAISEVGKPLDDHPMKCRLLPPASCKLILLLFYLGLKKKKSKFATKVIMNKELYICFIQE